MMKYPGACVLWASLGLLWVGGGRLDKMATAHVLILPNELHSSDGCGPNPLSIVFTAANDLGHMAASEVMSVLESDPDTWGEFLTLIHSYDDCIRAGQLRYKRRATASLKPEVSQVQGFLRNAMKSPSPLATPLGYKYGHNFTKMPRNASHQLLQKLLPQEGPYLHRETSDH